MDIRACHLITIGMCQIRQRRSGSPKSASLNSDYSMPEVSFGIVCSKENRVRKKTVSVVAACNEQSQLMFTMPPL